MKRTITETAPDDLCVLYRLLLPFQNCLGVLCFLFGSYAHPKQTGQLIDRGLRDQVRILCH